MNSANHVNCRLDTRVVTGGFSPANIAGRNKPVYFQAHRQIKKFEPDPRLTSDANFRSDSCRFYRPLGGTIRPAKTMRPPQKLYVL